MILESLSELNEHVGLLGFLKYAGSLTKLRRWLLIAVSDNADLKPPIINKLGWLEVWQPNYFPKNQNDLQSCFYGIIRPT